MKLKSLILNNFRSYSEETIIEFDDLTALIGKNDSGKSTILEALDYFFNEGSGGGIIKIDKEDVSIGSDSDEILIGAIFTDLPNKIILDTSVETALEDEFLLDEDGNLKIYKIIKNGKTISTKIIAQYPSELDDDIHSLTIQKLKVLLEQRQLSVEDNRKASLLRQAILKSYDSKELKQVEIETKANGVKDIWSQLKKYLPVYSLFQSDRKNQDKDGEIQDPMKEAVKEILADEEISNILEGVSSRVKEAVEDVANRTLDKLSEMNEDIASELKPIFQTIKWDKVFDITLNSDDGIPLNKRGSGVRRMILLNFFRAQAEKRSKTSTSTDVIYAFEEPETSQHPEHQKKLIESFLELSKISHTQIILTTHSPELCGMIPTKSLRMVDKYDKSNINSNDDDILNKISKTLGVLPTLSEQMKGSVKVVVCVEGKNDVSFLKNINESIEDLKNIVNINGENIIIIPMGGSTLKDWINNRYLEKLDLNQVHIYDSDIGSNSEHKYKKYIEELNTQNNCKAYETALREMENYVGVDILTNKGIIFTEDIKQNWATSDIPEYCAKYLYNNNDDSDKQWGDLTEKVQKEKISRQKKRINSEYCKDITREDLEKLDVYNEVELWFKSIKEFLE